MAASFDEGQIDAAPNEQPWPVRARVCVAGWTQPAAIGVDEERKKEELESV
jgi:hypothetical protein